MQVTDEADLDRVEDATAHDEVFLMFGDPKTGRPLIKLSVTKDGNAIIEYDVEDLADGIRAINRTISGALAARPAQNIDDLLACVFLNSGGGKVHTQDLMKLTHGAFSTRELGESLRRFRVNGMIEKAPGFSGGFRITEQGARELRAGD